MAFRLGMPQLEGYRLRITWKRRVLAKICPGTEIFEAVGVSNDKKHIINNLMAGNSVFSLEL